MICPKCKMEFQNWVTECTDCHIPLVETPKEVEPEFCYGVKLTETPDAAEAGLLKNLLENQGISVFVKSPGSGDFMNIFMGYTIYGEEIYVASEDYSRAREILMELKEPADAEGNSQQWGEESPQEEPEELEEKSKVNWMIRIGIMALLVFIGISILLRLVTALYVLLRV